MKNKNDGIFLLDIGNTNTLIGYSKINEKLDDIKSFRFSTNKSATIDDFGLKLAFVLNSLKIDKNNIKFAIISSVVPEIDENIRQTLIKYINCKIVFTNEIETSKVSKLLKINYKNPDEIGADRLVNAIAASKLYDYPAIIIDIGTASTIDIVNDKNEFIGGVIFSGIGLSAHTLAKMTSKLPKINIEETEKIIGTNTSESINIGIYHGFLGTIKYFCDKLKQKKYLKNAKIILTGGYTDIYKKRTEIFDINDLNLTMKGLKIIFLKFFK
jgi:type III pantothenate kinase